MNNTPSESQKPASADVENQPINAKKNLRKKNYVLLAVLILLMIGLYAMSMVRFGATLQPAS